MYSFTSLPYFKSTINHILVNYAKNYYEKLTEQSILSYTLISLSIFLKSAIRLKMAGKLGNWFVVYLFAAAP